jgi:hypothetical protein
MRLPLAASSTDAQPSFAGASMHQNVNVSLSGRQVKFQVMLAFVFESE